MPAFVMKRLPLSIGVVALAILASALAFALELTPFAHGEAAAAGRAYVTRYVEDGDRASYGVYRFGEPPLPAGWLCSMYVEVSRGMGKAGQATAVYYGIEVWDPDWRYWEDWGEPYPDPLPEPGGCRVVAGGWGQIPDSAYVVKGPVHTLDVDTTQVPGFEHWAGTGGRITITWRKVGTFEYRSTGTSQERSPSRSSSRTGTWSDSSAAATGTILGREILPVEAGEKAGSSIGWSKGVTVCRSTDPDLCYYGGK